MHILVRLSEHVSSTQDSGSFLHQTLAAALVASKQNLDRLMRAQIDSVQSCPPPKRSKCGVLPFVSNFQVSWEGRGEERGGAELSKR